MFIGSSQMMITAKHIHHHLNIILFVHVAVTTQLLQPNKI